MEDKPDFQPIRQALEQERLQILQNLVEDEAGPQIPETFDEGDLAALHENSELMSLLNEMDQQRLEKITKALARINQGTYGICQRCGGRIPIERLMVLPYTELCIACQALLEAKGSQGRRVR